LISSSERVVFGLKDEVDIETGVVSGVVSVVVSTVVGRPLVMVRVELKISAKTRPVFMSMFNSIK